MTAVDVDLQKLLDDYDRRLYELEQLVTSTSVMTTGAPVTIVDPDTGDIVIILPTHPDDVSGLTATPGSFYNNIFVDVDWDAATGGTQASSYEVELAEKVGITYDFAAIAATSGTNYRFDNLKPFTTYGVRVAAISNIGLRGELSDWVDFATTADSTIPPAVTGVSLYRGASSAVVKFTGLTAAQAPDVANGNGLYEIQIDTINLFGTSNLQIMRSTATIVAFEGVDNPAGYYARVAPIDASGNQGPWSSVVGPVIAGGIIDDMVVAGLSAAKITFGIMSGDRIAVNTLDAASIKTSSITAATITISSLGQIKIGNPPTTGVQISNLGIRAYQGNLLKFSLDAVTGSATFRGTVDSSTITASNLYGAYITGGTIIGNSIAGNTITGSTISGGTISGTTISGTNISGTNISGGTITGSLVRTASSGRRMELATTGNLSTVFFFSGGAETYFIQSGVNGRPGTGGVECVLIGWGSYYVSVDTTGTYIHGQSWINDLLYVGNGSGPLLILDGATGNFFATGDVGGGTKSFVISHPLDDQKILRHGSLEGPEYSVYYRGQTQLINSSVEIELPDYFEALTSTDDRTVQLTAISTGNNDCLLSATYPQDGKFVVSGNVEDASFFWEVTAVRKDVGSLVVESLKSEVENSPIPSF